jgi:hypothetical protein
MDRPYPQPSATLQHFSCKTLLSSRYHT